jgi:hypothetical protein
MTSFSVAVRIWMKTVFLFGVCVGFAAAMEDGIIGLLFGALAFFLGFVITLPLLLPIYSLVDISRRLIHYGIPARLAWLTFYLSLMFFSFYELVSQIADNHFIDIGAFFCQWIMITIGILLVAVLTTCKSLNILYTQNNISSSLNHVL